MPKGATSLRLTVRADSKTQVTLLDVSSFLYDFNLLYEVSRLAVDSKYENFHFSQAIYYRQGRPLDREDRLTVRRLNYGSPLEVVATIGVVGPAAGAVASATWLTVQAFERIANFRLNRRKLKAELEKLERENRDAAVAGSDPKRAERLLQRREASAVYENVVERLRDADISVVEVTIRVVRRGPHGKLK